MCGPETRQFKNNKLNIQSEQIYDKRYNLYCIKNRTAPMDPMGAVTIKRCAVQF